MPYGGAPGGDIGPTPGSGVGIPDGGGVMPYGGAPGAAPGNGVGIPNGCAPGAPVTGSRLMSFSFGFFVTFLEMTSAMTCSFTDLWHVTGRRVDVAGH